MVYKCPPGCYSGKRGEKNIHKHVTMADPRGFGASRCQSPREGHSGEFVMDC